MVLGSGDGEDDEMIDEGPVKGPFLVIIIVGSVLLFILLCLVIPCIIECRKCRREGKNVLIWHFKIPERLKVTSNDPDLIIFIGHCCCAMFGSKTDDEDEEYQGQSSLERQKAQMAGYA